VVAYDAYTGTVPTSGTNPDGSSYQITPSETYEDGWYGDDGTYYPGETYYGSSHEGGGTFDVSASGLPAHTHVRDGGASFAISYGQAQAGARVTGPAGEDTYEEGDYFLEVPGAGLQKHEGSSWSASYNASGFGGTDVIQLWGTGMEVFTPGVSIAAYGSSTTQQDTGDAVQFTVSRDGDSTVWDVPLTVSLTYDDDVTGPATVEIPIDSGVSQPFSVTPVDDSEVEGDELAGVTVQPGSNYEGNATAYVTLLALSTPFTVGAGQSLNIYGNLQAPAVNLAVTINEGTGQLIATVLDDEGNEKKAEYEYNATGSAWGVLIGGKVKAVEVRANSQTTGTITKE